MNVAKSFAQLAFTPVNPKPASTQPFHEDDDDEEEGTNQRATQDSPKGNYIRKIVARRAQVAQMRPRGSVYDVPGEDARPASSLGEKMKAMQQRKSAKSTPSANRHPDRNSAPVQDESQPGASRTGNRGMPLEAHATSHPITGVNEANPDMIRPPLVNGDNNANMEGAEEEGSDDENMSDGEFEVESISSHKFVKRELLFEVKWKGWGKEDNTFEPEANLNAPEILSAYLEKIGGRPKPKAGVGRPKKVNALRGPIQLVTRPKTSSVARPIRRGPNLADHSEGEQDIPTPDPNDPEPWSTPDIAPGSWDHLVLKVHHFHRTSRQCFVGIHWIAEDNQGCRYATREEYWAAKIAAPQALFAYFEANVKFNNTDRVGIPKTLTKPPPGYLNDRAQKRPAESSQTSLPRRTKRPKR